MTRNRARDLLREAWSDLDRAEEAGVDAGAVAPLRGASPTGWTRSTASIDADGGRHAARGCESGHGRGPDDAAYLIASRQVVRVDPPAAAVVDGRPGRRRPGHGHGRADAARRGGLDLLIVDVRGGLWRWRDRAATGRSVDPVGGDQAGAGRADIGTFVINADRSLYRLYVPHPTSSQILRYEPVGRRQRLLAAGALLRGRGRGRSPPSASCSSTATSTR
jgi:hypothetical protein